MKRHVKNRPRNLKIKKQGKQTKYIVYVHHVAECQLEAVKEPNITETQYQICLINHQIIKRVKPGN